MKLFNLTIHTVLRKFSGDGKRIKIKIDKLHADSKNRKNKKNDFPKGAHTLLSGM